MNSALIAKQRHLRRELMEKLLPFDLHSFQLKTEQLKFCDMRVSELRKAIKKGQMTLVCLIKLFYYRMTLDRNRHNSMTDVFYKSSVLRAKAFDLKIKEMSQFPKKFPLLGFVLSVKDSFQVKNSSSTFGFACLANRPFKTNSRLIEILERSGALILCKGNVPQGLMLMESHSTAYGDVLNVYDRKRTAGGSSGGDAVGVALGLVNAAIGSDVGGSLRIPALFNGIISFKPTAGRLADGSAPFGIQPSQPTTLKQTEPVIKSTLGPLARSVNEVKALTKFLIDISSYYNIPNYLPWRTERKIKKKIAMVTGFNRLMTTTITMQRALNICLEKLRQNGFEIVEVNIEDLVETMHIQSNSFFLDEMRGIDVLRGLGLLDEPLDQAYLNFIETDKFSIADTEQLLSKSQSFQEKTYLSCSLDSRKYNENQRIKLRKKIIGKVTQRFIDNNVEVGLFYGLPPAPRVGAGKDVCFMCSYTYIWNYLNYPTGSLPVTKVKKGEEKFKKSPTDIFHCSLEREMEGSFGLPVGIQVLGLPNRDEEVILLMEILEKLLKSHINT